MQGNDGTSFGEAAAWWICRRDRPLSASTERAYRGEIDRLAQFFAVKHGGLKLSDFSEAHWDEYADEVRGHRIHVVTCQEKPLAPASAEQAIRISAAFLRWARDEGLLSWAPKARRAQTHTASVEGSQRRALVDFSAAEEPVHPELYALLSTPLRDGAGLGPLRAHMAVLLAYWGGLGSSEIASLKCDDLLVDAEALWLRHPRFKNLEQLQGGAANTWLRYRHLRQEQPAGLTGKSPVIAALGADEPISAWSAWALIAKFVAQVTGAERRHSAQSLRRFRMRQVAADLETPIGALARYAQCGRIDFNVSSSAQT